MQVQRKTDSYSVEINNAVAKETLRDARTNRSIFGRYQYEEIVKAYCVKDQKNIE